MTNSKYALMTVTLEPHERTVEAAAERLGVTAADLDDVFGVVAVDPATNLCSVQVRASALPRAASEGEPYHGPFSNPRIEHFGPPETDKRKK